MREAWRKIDKLSAEVRLISRENLRDLPMVDAFISSTKSNINAVTFKRNRIYNQLRRCTNPEQITELKLERDACTTILKELRKDVKTAEGIVKRNPEIKKEIAIEESMRQKLRPPQRQRKRGYER